jgi:4-oxalocrotonate tautomerase
MSTAARAPVTDSVQQKEIAMPIVTIQATRGGSGPGRTSVTSEEKAQLIAGVSQLLLDVLHKPLDATFVVIEEVELENWGWGGLPVPEYRKRRGELVSPTS